MVMYVVFMTYKGGPSTTTGARPAAAPAEDFSSSPAPIACSCLRAASGLPYGLHTCVEYHQALFLPRRAAVAGSGLVLIETQETLSQTHQG